MIHSYKKKKNIKECYQKGQKYYSFRASQQFKFTEEKKGQNLQEKDEQEIVFQCVYIDFILEDGQSGIISEEYRAPQAMGEGKAVDIFAILFSDEQRRDKKYKVYLIDAKEHVSDEHDVEHLIEQWCDSIMHARCFTQYLCQNGSDIIAGVATNSVDFIRIKRIHSNMIKEVERFEKAPKENIVVKKIMMNIERKKMLIPKIGCFLDGKFMFDGKEYKYTVYQTTYNNESNENSCRITMAL